MSKVFGQMRHKNVRLNSSIIYFLQAKPQDSLTAPIHNHFVWLSLTNLDIFWMQLPKLNNIFVSETCMDTFSNLWLKVANLIPDRKSQIGTVSESWVTGFITVMAIPCLFNQTHYSKDFSQMRD